MDPVGLGELLERLPHHADPNLLVGFHTSDDASVYRLTDEIAIVNTVDLITPPVDDPFAFGRIAAANSLSDVYAMGGRPVTCLNVVCFPSKKLPAEQLHAIIEGALEKINEAGAVLAGGHSVEDEEPKFGLSVTGVVHPDKVWANAGARPGDALVLTKPIGSGVLFNGNLKRKVSAEAMRACIATVETLNRVACEVLQGFAVHAATDITGFGLAGHGLEMARGSGVRMELDLHAVPILAEAVAMYEAGVTTGVNRENRRLVEPHLEFGSTSAPTPSAARKEILFDPQTSGGLLVALPEYEADEAIRRLHDAGVLGAVRIGSVHERPASSGGPYLLVR